MKWVCFPKFYSPLANWPWLRISPQSSLCVIYCLILTAWQWLMSFTCILMQIEPNKCPLRKRLLVILFWEISYLSSPSRLCLGRLILTCGGWGRPMGRAPPSTTDENKSTKTWSAWGRKVANLSKEKGQEPFPQWAFIGFNLHRNTGKAHQSLSGSNDQTIDNIQRTTRAYSESGSVS